MTGDRIFRVVENTANMLAEGLCPWCGDDFNRDRHPKAPPLDCAWCQQRARLLRDVSYLSRAEGAPGEPGQKSS